MFSEEYQRLYFIACRDISADEQLFYDYNDTDPEALQEPGNNFLQRPSKRSKQGHGQKTKQGARRSVKARKRKTKRTGGRQSSSKKRGAAGAGTASPSEESAGASSINTVCAHNVLQLLSTVAGRQLNVATLPLPGLILSFMHLFYFLRPEGINYWTVFSRFLFELSVVVYCSG